MDTALIGSVTFVIGVFGGMLFKLHNNDMQKYSDGYGTGFNDGYAYGCKYGAKRGADK